MNLWFKLWIQCVHNSERSAFGIFTATNQPILFSFHRQSLGSVRKPCCPLFVRWMNQQGYGHAPVYQWRPSPVLVIWTSWVVKCSICILLKFYIKLQLHLRLRFLFFCCILLKFYIKSQPTLDKDMQKLCCILLKFYIKSQRRCLPMYRQVLYLIEILHQITTKSLRTTTRTTLYLIEILHQITTQAASAVISLRCILLKFYIKSQPAVRL